MAEDGDERHEGPLRRKAEQLEDRYREHRHEHEREAEDRRLREDLAAAGFDAETDTGIDVDRSGRHGRGDYDVEADTGEQVHPDRDGPRLDETNGGLD